MYEPVFRQDKLSYQVANQIEELYLKGELATGSRLATERELCEKFNVSRTVIREALNILNAKGLLETQPGSGTYIQQIEVDNISEVFKLYYARNKDKYEIEKIAEFRRIIEIQSAKLAAANRTDENVKKLQEIIEGMDENVTNRKKISKLDIEFHMEIIHSTQNTFLELIYTLFSNLIESFVEFSNILPGRTEASAKSHKAILKRIVNKDIEGAAVEMEKHMKNFERISLLTKKRQK